MIESGHLLQQRYRIDRQIGQGGMGAVYVATDERFGSTVAIKETLCMDDNYRKAIEREARLLNSLKHPALPRVSDHFLESDGQFLVMEYIAGEDLYCIMEREKTAFPVDRVLDWADQLLDALDFLHNQVSPVIHRDIKPQNLKATARGQIILLDFGLAKGNPTDAGHHTAAKSIFGFSRNYASLEQIQGTGTDPRSDLYSLAATLYHLLTDRPPEDALTRAMAVLSHQPDPLIPANAIEPSIPAGVAGVLQNAMDLNAAARPASAAEMRRMLREHHNYAGFLTAKPQAFGAATSSHFLDQSTKLLPGSTQQPEVRQTHIKTEVLPQFDSEETRLRSAGDSAAAKHSFGRKAVIAAVAGALLMVGAAAGIALFEGYDSVPTRMATEAPSVSTENALTEAEKETAIRTSSANAESTKAGSDAVAAETGKSTLPSRSVAANKSRRNRQPEKRNTDKSDEAQLHRDAVYVGNVKIVPGRIETPGVVVDEKGVFQKPPNFRPVPIAPPIYRRHLTPEEIRRLQQMRRRRAEGVPKPTP